LARSSLLPNWPEIQFVVTHALCYNGLRSSELDFAKKMTWMTPVRTACLISFMLMLLSLGTRSSFAGECLISGPRYQLHSDTVEWRMEIEDGKSCIRSVRFDDVANATVHVISPPQSGRVVLLGPAFSYSARSGFHGEDSFAVVVSGDVNKVSGTSTIRVVVSVVGASQAAGSAMSSPRNRSPAAGITPTDITPPSVSFTTPKDDAIVSGRSVIVTATATDDVAVAGVQFIVDGKKIGSAASAPYVIVWNSTAVVDGRHTLYAVAQDTAGNYGTAAIHVTVINE
jgi:Bacterial Ig domain